MAKKKIVTVVLQVDVAARGKKGGEARARNLTAKQRSESARLAAQARWAGKKAAK